MSIDLGLDRVEKLLSKFETYTRPTVHIAGTNGKGSVSALLTSIFQASKPPCSVGRFNSPHLVDIVDCITINDKPISHLEFEAVRDEVEDANKSYGCSATGFEVLTVTALLVFERNRVDVVVCEVGLGGRLDATNVIPDDAILASVITSIDLDHQAFLGSTVEAIMREKAGIIRRGKPIVVSEQKYSEVVGVVVDVARKLEAELIVAPAAIEVQWNEELDGEPHPSFSINPFQCPPPRPVEVSLPSSDTLRLLLPLHGEHQLVNLGVAISLINYLQTITPRPASLSSLNHAAVQSAVLKCTWPGRLSFHSYQPKGATRPLVILADGAHNEAASQMLSAYISSLIASSRLASNKRTFNLTYILGLSHSPPKTPESVISPLLSFPDLPPDVRLKVRLAALRFTPPAGMPWVKSVSPSTIKAVVAGSSSLDNHIHHTDLWTASDDEIVDATSVLQEALQWASQWNVDDQADDADHLVVVAGSLYLVADLYHVLNGDK